jgi:hypothetical protein
MKKLVRLLKIQFDTAVQFAAAIARQGDMRVARTEGANGI